MKIIQPRDVNVTTPNGSFVFQWNPRFGEMMSERIQKTQRFIDSETMRLMVPYRNYNCGGRLLYVPTATA